VIPAVQFAIEGRANVTTSSVCLEGNAVTRVDVQGSSARTGIEKFFHEVSIVFASFEDAGLAPPFASAFVDTCREALDDLEVWHGRGSFDGCVEYGPIAPSHNDLVVVRAS